ncbi:hypothetical protein NWE61_02965 [Mycoplasmopsis felis]|uniref:hypothetical protein n=1 Tax=Mycoplasmopsis felis TaxID=33923 RepID=UPI0021DF78D4|nr:hypothetical protein [Mycoplasmopsis felis]MCU9934124.1 hypothetical protein [Mycoplasmopsis felis]
MKTIKKSPLTPNPSERDVNFKDRMSIVIKNWKPVQYRDIKPKNNSHFTDQDFIPIPLGKKQITYLKATLMQ